MRSRNRGLLRSSLLASAVLGCAYPAFAAEATPAPAPGNAVDAVIVTAQKRSENVQNVPMTVQVLPGAQLEQQGITGIVDIEKLVPALFVLGSGPTGTSGPGSELPILRGMSTGGGGGVGVYLDEVPLNMVGLVLRYFDPNLTDLDDIEVLEGPQSTLYGANAMSGVIKYTTKQPNLSSYSAKVRGDVSGNDYNGSGYGIELSGNIPIISDKLAIRVSGVDREDPGFVRNVHYGSQPVNEEKLEGGQFAILYKPITDLSNTVSGYIQDGRAPGSGNIYLNPQTLKPLNGVLAYDSPLHDIVQQLAASVVSDRTNWESKYVTVTNILAHTHVKSLTQNDFGLYPPAFLGAPASVGAMYQEYNDTDQTSEELRAASAPGRLEAQAGLYAVHSDSRFHATNRPTSAANGQFLPPTFALPNGTPFYNLFDSRNHFSYTEWALFGDITYHFTDSIYLTGGVRHSSNTQHQAIDEGGLVYGPRNIAAVSSGDASNTYLVTANWKLNENLTTYARISSAYQPGEAQFLPPQLTAAGIALAYKPDYMVNYEIGAKGTALDRKMSYTLTAFRMQWTQLQVGAVLDGLSYVTNAGSAQSTGVEGSIAFRPVPPLKVSVNAAYIDAKITADVPTLNAVSGNPLPFDAKYSGSLLADYRFDVVHGVSPSVGLTYMYRSSASSGFSGEDFGVGTHTMPAYQTLDIRAGFDWSNYSLVFRVTNVGNSYGLTDVVSAPDAGGPLTGVIIKPRTYGVSLTAAF